MRRKLNTVRSVFELQKHKQGYMKDVGKQSVLCYSLRSSVKENFFGFAHGEECALLQVRYL